MNIAAVASSFGVIVTFFQWGWGSEFLGLCRAGPIEPFLPVIMISVLFGLSMDYQVFLVSRMDEEWRETGDNCRTVCVGLAETSWVINSAAVIMIAVFAAFVLSGDRIIAMFGIGLPVAVALDAFVLRTLLVPALMHRRRQLVAPRLARPLAAPIQYRAAGARCRAVGREDEGDGAAYGGAGTGRGVRAAGRPRRRRPGARCSV